MDILARQLYSTKMKSAVSLPASHVLHIISIITLIVVCPINFDG